MNQHDRLRQDDPDYVPPEPELTEDEIEVEPLESDDFVDEDFQGQGEVS